jgi:putative ubiquitin-RnfH superfamily antitoxin RatB of RatAB toxin-antitoxin module
MATEPAVVEVVYALASEQSVVPLAWRAGFTAEQAVRESGLVLRYPEIALHPLVLGIFGRAAAGSQVLVPGDRVEICRPLIADPREARRVSVRSGRAGGIRKSD